jgi:hypothetical protein
MALQRPLVLVFQELAAPTAAPSIPDLNTVILGPAYDLLDYPDDAASILLSSTYGQLGQTASYVPPIEGAAAVTVLDGAYPQQSPGALVDRSSVSIVLKYPQVILGTTNVAVTPTLGTSVAMSVADRTLVTLVGGTIGSSDFVTAGVQAGDTITLTSFSGQTLVRTVARVGDPNASGLVPSGNEILLRLSQDMPAQGTTDGLWDYTGGGGVIEMRIERALDIQGLVNSTGSIITFPDSEDNKLVITGGITLTVALRPAATVGTPSPDISLVQRRLSYSQLYLAYRAIRQNLQDLAQFTTASFVTVNNTPTINGLGKIDSRNPLAVGVSVALQNSGTAPIYAYGVPTNDLTGHASARAALSTRRDLYCFVPLAQDIDIIASYKSEFDAMANPLTALADGVIQKFRIVVGSVPLPLTSTVYSGSISGSYTAISSGTGLFRTLTIATASAKSVASVLPGDLVTIGLTDADLTWQNRRGTHVVGHVNDSYERSGSAGSIFEIVPGSIRWDSTAAAVGTSNSEIVIRSPDGTLKLSNLASLSIGNVTGQVDYVMKSPTVVGGPYTVTYGSAAALSVSIVGFAITVLVGTVGPVSTHLQVAAAINAHPRISTLIQATASGVTGEVCNFPVSAQSIVPAAGSCTVTISENDALYNILYDASAQFLTAGVKSGDVLEFPLDPQDYSANAFNGRLLSYSVSSVMSETRVLIANGLDDSGNAANEIPHFFARDVSGRFISLASSTNRMNYRVRRRLSKDDQVLSLATIAQSVRSKRCTLTWPDVVQVSDLRNGSLYRGGIPGVRTVAGDVPGYYVGCQVGGACAGLPSQHGLTNLGLSGINVLKHSQGYFTERHLTRLSEGGFFIMIQHTPGALPVCIHQLTTDATAIETGELSVVKNVDFISKFFLDLLEPFIGVYNVTAATQNTIQRTIDEGAANLKSRSLDRIGPPLISGEVSVIQVSEFDASRIEIYFRGVIPKPLNTIAFHLVV